MNYKTYPLALSVLTATVTLASHALAASQDVEAALALVRQIQPDRCALQKVRGKILVAHQSHDQSTMDALAPQMDALTARLKPAEDKLRELTVAIKKNPTDQNVYAAAQTEAASCH